MNILRKTIIKILAPSSALNFVGVFIYKAVFYSIVLYWKWRFPSTLIWARNSYQSKDLMPGLSDIDFTIVSTDDHLPLLANEVLINFKKLFMIMGEINFYTTKSLGIIKEVYNYYELQRDPLLMSFANLSKKSNSIDAAIYLMRTYESDKDNIENRSHLRHRKWTKVFQLLEVSIDKLSKTALLDLLRDRIGKNIISNPMLYSPHTWLESHWSKLKYPEVVQSFSKLSEPECEIIFGQIRWEVFGILTQLPFLKNRSDMKYHFENLKTILSYLPIRDEKLEEVLDQAKLLV